MEKKTETKLPGVYNNEQELVIINACIETNTPVLLMGETGTGKTTLVRSLAKKKRKKLVRINLNGQTGREELLGKYTLNEGNLIWQDGLLLDALKSGHWILLDEINAALPEVLLILQALLEVQNGKLGKITLVEKDGEEIVPQKSSRIFATCNPTEYAGTKEFNSATLSRFIVVAVRHLSQADESKLIQEKHGLSATDANRLVEIASKARKMKDEGLLTFFVSTRDMEQAATLMSKGVEMPVAVVTTMLNKSPNKVEHKLFKDEIDKIVGLPDEEITDYSELKSALEREVKLRRQLKRDLENERETNKSMKNLIEYVRQSSAVL